MKLAKITKALEAIPTRMILVAGISGTIWGGLAAIALSLVTRANGGTITGPDTWFLITTGSLGAAIGGWHTPPLLQWLARTIRSRNSR